MDDFRCDRDPDDHDADFDPQFNPSMSAPASGVSDDDEPTDTHEAVVFDHEALAKILLSIDTTFTSLSLSSKVQKDALCDEIIHALNNRKHSHDTTIKPPQRPGRRRQSAAARPTPGAKPPASSDATDQFWGAVPVGRPRTTSAAPHRMQLPSSSVLMSRLTAPVSTSSGAAAATMVTSKRTVRMASKPVLAAAPSTFSLSTVPFTASYPPIAAAAAVASGGSPTRTREDRLTPPSPVEPDAKRRHTHSTPSTQPRSNK